MRERQDLNRPRSITHAVIDARAAAAELAELQKAASEWLFGLCKLYKIWKECCTCCCVHQLLCWPLSIGSKYGGSSIHGHIGSCFSGKITSFVEPNGSSVPCLLAGPNGTDSQATSQADSTDGNEDTQPAKPALKPRAQHKVSQPNKAPHATRHDTISACTVELHQQDNYAMCSVVICCL